MPSHAAKQPDRVVNVARRERLVEASEPPSAAQAEDRKHALNHYISGVEVDHAEAEAIAIDAGTFEALRQLTFFDGDPKPIVEPPTVDDILDTMERRLRRKLLGPGSHPVWRALSERLEELPQARVAGAKDSVAC